MRPDIMIDRSLTLFEAIRTAKERFPARTALVYLHRRYSYVHLLDRVRRFAAGLRSLNVKKGDIVTVCLPNIPDAVYLLYAINQLGAIASILHPLYNLTQLRQELQTTKSRLVFVLSLMVKKFAPLKEEGITVISCSPAADINPFLRAIYERKNLKTTGPLSKNETTASFYNLRPYEGFIHEPDADAVYLNSGGTSGHPKKIALSSRAINALDWNGLHLFKLTTAKNKGMLSVLPMFHGFGLAVGVHALLAHGGVDVLMPKFSARATVRYIRRGRIQFLIGVPILYEALLAKKGFKGRVLRSLEAAYVGGDFVPPSLFERFDERMKAAGAKARLYEGYGLTETVTVCTVNMLGQNKPGTVGRPLLNVRLRIIDPESGKTLGPNEEGELLVSGETLMNGYRYCAKEVAEAVFHVDEDGTRWIRTGDWGRIDEDGYFTFIQRLKRIVKVNGIPVYPSLIESVVSDLSFIYECAAIGVSDLKRGHMIKLFVVLHRDYQGTKEDAERLLYQTIEEKCGVYARPREIIWQTRLPHTMLGKVDVKVLQ